MSQVGKKARINGLRNLMIAPLETDTAAATTYGAAVSLGAQSKLTWAPAYTSSELRTSRGLENRRSYLDHITWSIEYGEIDLDALKHAMNGKVLQQAEASSGSKDSKSIFAATQGLSQGYIGIIGQPDTAEAGPADFYIMLAKCQVDTMNTGDMGEGWAKITMSGQGLFTLKDKLIFGMATLEKVTDMTFTVALTDLEAALTTGT